MNRAKQKGTAFEVRVRDYLNGRGAQLYRPAPAGSRDCGDLIGMAGWVIECKNVKGPDLAGAMDEALRERDNEDTAAMACVIKHRNRANVRRAYVVMELEQWATLVGLQPEPA